MKMEVDYKARYEALAAKYSEVSDELKLAKAKLTENPVTIGMVRESKIDRQRQALRILNRRVRVQRLQLRKLNEMERGLRPEEWQALKEEFAHEFNEDDWEIED